MNIPRLNTTLIYFGSDKNDETINQISSAIDFRYHSKFYPFTRNIIMDELLTGWSIYSDENNILFPIVISPLWNLYHCDKEKLYDFIMSGVYGVCFSNNLLMIRNKITNLDSLSRWELIYLVLELVNSGCPDNKKYPKSLWDLFPGNSLSTFEILEKEYKNIKN